MLLSLLSSTDRSRVEPAVISLSAGGDLAEDIRALGIAVESLGMRPSRPNPADVWRLSRRIRSLRPDIVQTWMYHADLVGGFANRLGGQAGLVWGLHNSDLDPKRTKTSTRFIARLCGLLSHHLPDRIVSCSETAARLHVQLGYDANKFIVIPNGFDTDKFQPDRDAYDSVRRELAIPSDTRLVGLVARLDPQKDHANFIEAAGRVAALHDDVRFVVVGAGCVPGAAELQSWIASTGVAERFHLLGLRRDVPRLLAALDLSVTSSAYGEAFPLVIGESMSSGVPCVATDVGDSAVIIGDTGQVVPPRNARALADAISAVLALGRVERASLGRSARERVKARYSLPAVASRYQSLYDEIYSQRGAREGGRRNG
jgi:glycosyltransferase involved in cell wall biosynthesis